MAPRVQRIHRRGRHFAPVPVLLLLLLLLLMAPLSHAADCTITYPDENSCFDSGALTADECGWDGTQCISCAAVIDESSCAPATACWWDAEVSKCKASRRQCSLFNTFTCESQVYQGRPCYWLSSGNICLDCASMSTEQCVASFKCAASPQNSSVCWQAADVCSAAQTELQCQTYNAGCYWAVDTCMFCGDRPTDEPDCVGGDGTNYCVLDFDSGLCVGEANECITHDTLVACYDSNEISNGHAASCYWDTANSKCANCTKIAASLCSEHDFCYFDDTTSTCVARLDACNTKTSQSACWLARGEGGSCNWDESAGSCIDCSANWDESSCLSHGSTCRWSSGDSMCTADDGCTYEFVDKRSCDLAATTANCAWDADTGTCNSCSSYSAEACTTTVADRCTWDAPDFAQVCTSKAVNCSYFTGTAYCDQVSNGCYTKNGECVQDTAPCTSQGDELSCVEATWREEKCFWSGSVCFSCIDKTNGDACLSRDVCFWDFATSVCRSREAECNAGSAGSADCESATNAFAECGWSETEQACVSCPLLTDGSQCFSTSEACTWNDEYGFCARRSAPNDCTGLGESECLSAAALGCFLTYFSECKSCLAERVYPDCAFDGEEMTCWADVTTGECKPDAGCSFQNTQETCEASATEYRGPCLWLPSGGQGGGTCSECWEINEASVCNSFATCSWGQDENCESIHARCHEFDDMSQPLADCSALPSGGGTYGCVAKESGGVTKCVPCLRRVESECVALGQSLCTWDASSQLCVANSGADPSRCGRHSFDTAACMLQAGAGDCYVEPTTASHCFNCSSILLVDHCVDASCYVDAVRATCRAVGRECGDFAEEASCVTNRYRGDSCVWSNSECRSCSSFGNDAATCSSASDSLCMWSELTQRCLTPAALCDEALQQSECDIAAAQAHCAWTGSACATCTGLATTDACFATSFNCTVEATGPDAYKCVRRRTEDGCTHLTVAACIEAATTGDCVALLDTAEVAPDMLDDVGRCSNCSVLYTFPSCATSSVCYAYVENASCVSLSSPTCNHWTSESDCLANRYMLEPCVWGVYTVGQGETAVGCRLCSELSNSQCAQHPQQCVLSTIEGSPTCGSGLNECWSDQSCASSRLTASGCYLHTAINGGGDSGNMSTCSWCGDWRSRERCEENSACTWSTVVGQCIGAQGSDPWGCGALWEDAACIAEAESGCFWAPSLCATTEGCRACFNCSVISDPSDCNGVPARACVWDALNKLCRVANESCSTFAADGETTCVSNYHAGETCLWASALTPSCTSCSEMASLAACLDVSARLTATSAKCSWITVDESLGPQCVRLREFCASATSSTTCDSTAEMLTDCAWSASSTTCVWCGGAASPSACRALTSNCTWDPIGLVCKRLTDPDECATKSAAQCTVDNYITGCFVVDADSGECQSCSARAVENCAASSHCAFDFVGAVCRPKSVAACDSSETSAAVCALRIASGECIASGAGATTPCAQCSSLTASDDCRSASACFWTGSSCASLRTTCEAITDEATCAAMHRVGCVIHYSGLPNSCVPSNGCVCQWSGAYDAARCTSVNSLMWSTSASRCISAAGSNYPGCGDFTDEVSCGAAMFTSAANNCRWYVEPNTGVGACVSCSVFDTNLDACPFGSAARGCFVEYGKCASVGNACGVYNVFSCPSRRFYGGSCFVVDAACRSCSEATSEALCTAGQYALNCIWVGGAKDGFSCNSQRKICASTSSAGCNLATAITSNCGLAASTCVWCGDATSEAACTAISTACAWSSASWRCVRKTTPDCTFPTPADESTCLSLAGCAWVSRLGCGFCSASTTESACLAYSWVCFWNSSSATCGRLPSLDSCASQLEPGACGSMVESGCYWRAAIGRCFNCSWATVDTCELAAVTAGACRVDVATGSCRPSDLVTTGPATVPTAPPTTPQSTATDAPQPPPTSTSAPPTEAPTTAAPSNVTVAPPPTTALTATPQPTTTAPTQPNSTSNATSEPPQPTTAPPTSTPQPTVPEDSVVYCRSIPAAARTACWALPTCYFSTSANRCANYTEQASLAVNSTNGFVDALIAPSQVASSDRVVVSVFGAATLAAAIALLAAECPLNTSSAWTSASTVAVESTRYTFTFAPDAARDGMTLRVCLRILGASVVPLSASISFAASPQPQLVSCATSPAIVFAKSSFTITFVGFNLLSTDRVAVVSGANQSCTAALAEYRPIVSSSRVGDAGLLSSIARFSVAAAGTYRLCYRAASSAAVPTSCDGSVDVAAVAPWVDADVLGAAVSASPSIVTSDAILNVAAFNAKYCRSINVTSHELPATFLAGPLLHPTAMRATFGSLSTGYAANEACAVVVNPLATLAAASADAAIALNYDLSQLDATPDRLMIFVPLANYDAAKPPSTSALASTATLPSHCPLTIPNFSLQHIATRALVGTAVRSFRVPISGGAIVVICSDSSNGGGRLARIDYATAATLCPSDCRDAAGNSRGTCQANGVCLCDSGWQGPSCATPTSCAADSLAPQVSGDSGTLNFTAPTTASRCGFLVTATGSGIERAGSIGVGLRFTAASLGTNCSTSRIVVRRASHSGTPLVVLCQSNVTSRGVGVNYLVSDGATFYLEILSSGGAAASFSLAYTSVALGCPGTADDSGFVAEECGGFGTCIDTPYATQRALLRSAKQCICRSPYAASAAGETCDSCAVGFVSSSFPDCVAAAVCPDDCGAGSGRGRCGAVGCVCTPGYFGRSCATPDVYPAASLPAGDAMVVRLPLNSGAGADSTRQGGTDTTLITCELLPTGCAVEVRDVGNTFPTASTSGAASRRQENSSTPSPPSIVEDTALVLNSALSASTTGDYVRQLNISGTNRDVHGMFTVSAWVRVTESSAGFLLAKTDANFYSDGASPALEAAMFDVEDRHAAFEDLRLPRDNYTVYFGLFMNGPKKRVDVLVMNPSKRPTTNAGINREDWLVVRHFRLGDDAGALLFDGSWRYISFQFKRSTGNFDGQLFIDGETSPTNPNFIQCFPWLPVASADVPPILTDPFVTDTRRGGALIYGYRLQASIDEVRMFNKDVQHVTIVEIGGDMFKGALAVDTAALIATSVVAFVTVAGSMVLFVVRRRQRRKDDDAIAMLRQSSLAVSDNGMALHVSSPVNHESPLFQKIRHDGLVKQYSIEVVALDELERAATDLAVADVADGESFSPILATSAVGFFDGKHPDRTPRLSPQQLLHAAAEARRRSAEAVASATAAAQVPNGEYSDPEKHDDEDDDDDESSSVSTAPPPELEVTQPEQGDSREDGTNAPLSVADRGAAIGEIAINIAAVSTIVMDDDQQQQQQQSNRDASPALVVEGGGATFDSTNGAVAWGSVSNHSNFTAPAAGGRGAAATDTLEGDAEEDGVAPPALVNSANDSRRGGRGRVASTAGTAATGRGGGGGSANDGSVSERKKHKLRRRAMDTIDKELNNDAARRRKQAVKNVKDAGMLGDKAADAMGEAGARTAGSKAAAQGGNALSGSTGAKAAAASMSTDGNLVHSGSGVAALGTQLAGPVRDQLRRLNISRFDLSALGPVDALTYEAIAAVVGSARDCWQVLALLVSGFTWPTVFVDVYAKVASALSLNFDVALDVPFAVSFYLCAGLSIAAFIVLVVIAALETRRDARAVMEEKLQVLKDQRDGKADAEIKMRKVERVAWVALIVLSTLYLPVTRNAVAGIFCHKSVLCVYDCYAEPAHWAVVIVGIVTGVLITFFTPIAFFLITWQKKREFFSYFGSSGNASVDNESWVKFLRADKNPFASIFDAFDLRLAYFQTFQLLFKAVICFLALGLTPDSTEQIVCVVVTQCTFLALVAAASPFLLDACNFIVVVSQVYIVFMLGLDSIYRINPDGDDLPFSIVLNVLSFGTLLAQIAIIASVLRTLIAAKMGLSPV